MSVLQLRKFARPTVLGDIDDPQTWDAVADAPTEQPDDYVPRGQMTRRDFWFVRIPDNVEVPELGITDEDRIKLRESVTRTVIVDQIETIQTVAKKRHKLDVPNLRAELPKTGDGLTQAILDLITETDPTAPLYDYEANGVPIITKALLFKHLQDKTKALITLG